VVEPCAAGTPTETVRSLRPWAATTATQLPAVFWEPRALHERDDGGCTENIAHSFGGDADGDGYVTGLPAGVRGDRDDTSTRSDRSRRRIL
jgi:hypothetical protein